MEDGICVRFVESKSARGRTVLVSCKATAPVAGVLVSLRKEKEIRNETSSTTRAAAMAGTHMQARLKSGGPPEIVHTQPPLDHRS
jgi:hypothetical protein